MYASVASAASFSSQNLSKFGSGRGQPINTLKQVRVVEKNQKMSMPTTTPPTSPNRLKLKEKLVGIYDSLLQVIIKTNFWVSLIVRVSTSVKLMSLRTLYRAEGGGVLASFSGNIFVHCHVTLDLQVTNKSLILLLPTPTSPLALQV